MARGAQVSLAILLMASIVLSGCVSPEMQKWGADGIEVTIDESAGTATMSSYTGDHDLSDDVATLLGCDDEGNFSVAAASTDKPIRIEGWLHLSKHFPDGTSSTSKGEMVSTSAVIVQFGKYDEVIPPMQGKVEGVKDWHTPFLSVRATPPGFTSASKFPHDGWAIVGLIPANENILDGFAGLDWHQKIALEGWLVDGQYMGDNEVHVSDDGQCRIYAGANIDGFRGSMLVTSMTLSEHGLIDEENSYNAYSVPIFGTWLYSIILLGSIAGAAVLFFLSSGLIRRGAKLSARELMTEAQMLAAKTVKKEVKHDMHRVKSETGEKKKIKAAKAQVVQAEKLSEKPSIELDDFDIDSVMSEANRPSAHSVRSSTSAGVIETTESFEMQAQMDEADSLRELQDTIKQRQMARMGGKIEVPKGLPDKPTSPTPAKKTDAAKSQPQTRKVRKTKAVKKEPEPESKPEPRTRSGPDITDDDDFSDFAL